MSLAGDFLREIRGRLGFARSRRKFLDETNLPWEEETLRSLEDGTNLITPDHIRDMVSAGIFEKGDADYQTMVDVAKKDAAFRAQAKERLKAYRDKAGQDPAQEGGEEGPDEELVELAWLSGSGLGECLYHLTRTDLSQSQNPEIQQLYYAVKNLRDAVYNTHNFLIYLYDRESYDINKKAIAAKKQADNLTDSQT